MKIELVIGLIVLLATIVAVSLITGAGGLKYFSVILVLAAAGLYLNTRKSKVAKVSSYFVFPQLLFKHLLPKDTKNGLKELETRENET